MDEEIQKRGEKAARRLARSFAEREAEIRRRTLEGEDFNTPIRNSAAYSWTKNGIDYWLLRNYEFNGSWCGYARFASRPVKEPRYKGVLAYVPVHGGITYCQESPDGSVYYGFDCGHASDRPDMEMSAEATHRDHERRMKKFKRTRNARDLLPQPKRRRLSWLVKQVEGMAAGIRCAARIEDAFNSAQSEEEKARILAQFHSYLAAEGIGRFDLQDNGLLPMLNVLSGNL